MIYRGNQFELSVNLTINQESVDISQITDVEIAFNNNVTKFLSKGEITYNPNTENFTVFLTQEDTFKLNYAFEIQARVKFINSHIYASNKVTKTLGEILSKNNYRVLRIAETSKYPHVTHFIDGDKDVNLKYTTKILVPRKSVETYDEKPEMSAKEVTEKIKNLINDYDFVIVNYANGDMVGHTGNYDAAIKAVETVNKCIEDLYEMCFKKDILLIITADHGNCEVMKDKDDNPHTYHTTNKVPFIICDKKYTVKDGELKDIAPSILKILDIKKPKEMTGKVIIKKNKEVKNEKKIKIKLKNQSNN